MNEGDMIRDSVHVKGRSRRRRWRRGGSVCRERRPAKSSGLSVGGARKAVSTGVQSAT